MLVLQTNSVEVEPFSYVNTIVCSNKFAYMLATWLETLYCQIPNYQWNFMFFFAYDQNE